MAESTADKEDKVAIQRILVADRIIAGNLVAEEGCDLEQSANNLADMRGQIIMNYLEAMYPGVEVCVDIAIQREPGPARPVEVMVYVGEEEMDTAQSATIRQELDQYLTAGTTGQS